MKTVRILVAALLLPLMLSTAVEAQSSLTEDIKCNYWTHTRLKPNEPRPKPPPEQETATSILDNIRLRVLVTREFVAETQGWLAGYVSGLSVTRPAFYRTEELFKWTDSYCKKNPDYDLWKAGQVFHAERFVETHRLIELERARKMLAK